MTSGDYNRTTLQHMFVQNTRRFVFTNLGSPLRLHFWTIHVYSIYVLYIAVTAMIDRVDWCMGKCMNMTGAPMEGRNSEFQTLV